MWWWWWQTNLVLAPGSGHRVRAWESPSKTVRNGQKLSKNCQKLSENVKNGQPKLSQREPERAWERPEPKLDNIWAKGRYYTTLSNNPSLESGVRGYIYVIYWIDLANKKVVSIDSIISHEITTGWQVGDRRRLLMRTPVDNKMYLETILRPSYQVSLVTDRTRRLSYPAPFNWCLH